MPKIAYDTTNFYDDTLEVIDQANEIIAEYSSDGFDLTLRQLYYQFVARDLIPNKQKEYKRLGSIVNKGRMSGLIDWSSIEDRTRSLRGIYSYSDPKQLIAEAMWDYHIDMWENQDYYLEVWIEKDALTGVISRVCNKFDISFFSCRGYVSQSEMWRAGRRLSKKTQEGKTPVILHLGDHDPSGIDMSRDIEYRLNHFAVRPEHRAFDWLERPEYAKEHYPIELKRIALNMDQINELNPPPNPAKVSDSRFEGYLKEYGGQSWELDALEPKYIENLIEQEAIHYRSDNQWEADEERYESGRENLRKIRSNYGKIIKMINEEDE